MIPVQVGKLVLCSLDDIVSAVVLELSYLAYVMPMQVGKLVLCSLDDINFGPCCCPS